MKKILFIAPNLANGGMQRVLVTLANKLASAGHAVTVLLLSSDDALRDDLDNRIRLIKKGPKPVPGRRIPYIRHKLYDDGMWERRSSPRKLYDWYVGGERYDVEIAFFRGLSVKTVSGSVNSGAVHLAWVHNDYRLADGWQNLFNTRREIYEAYHSFDRVVCVSRQALEGYIQSVGDTGNAVTVYNMLPAERIRRLSLERVPEPLRRGSLNAVIAARLLDRAKGQLRLIDAVARLHGEGRDITLTIVGGGEDEERIRRLIEERDAGSYIAVTGEQRNPYPYIRSADLLVCASYFEGYNLTVAEALILGTPVLSTDCTGPSEILDGGRYGMIVENSGEGLYRGLKELCGDPALLKRYKDKAESRRDFFDEDRILKQITDLMDKP